MFVRIKTTPNSPRKSVQIVQSIRASDGKVKQKIIRHVGIAMNDKELERLKDLAEFIKAEMETETQPYMYPPEEMAKMAIECRKKKEDDKPIHVNLKKLREEKRIVLGIHEVYGKIYEEIGFDRIITNPKRNTSSANILKDIVLSRLANSVSKRESVSLLERDFGISLPLEKVYRMMDKLDNKAIANMQDIAYKKTCGLFKDKINVLFYDCTTLYFESFTEDELKQNGYSKDMKFNQPQVLLALLATEEGLPIGYEVFPGATFEGHTLVKILKQLKLRYELNNIIFVADRGMLSNDNLNLLEAEGFNYIVGARIRNMAKQIQEAILNESNYQVCKEEGNRTAVFEQSKSRSLIVHYSQDRARKDQHDRKKAIDKLLKKMSKNSTDPKALLNNYGYKKYLTVEGTARLKVNEEKIQQDAKWDGLHGVISNLKDIPIANILQQYRSLWQIEECFRVNKHDLKIRPIYHWTPDRIKAHIAIVFAAFVCAKHLAYRVGLQYKDLSIEAIRKELIHVQLCFLKHQETGKRYCVPSNVSYDAQKIYQVMGIKLSTTPFELK